MRFLLDTDTLDRLGKRTAVLNDFIKTDNVKESKRWLHDKE